MQVVSANTVPSVMGVCVLVCSRTLFCADYGTRFRADVKEGSGSNPSGDEEEAQARYPIDS